MAFTQNFIFLQYSQILINFIQSLPKTFDFGDCGCIASLGNLNDKNGASWIKMSKYTIKVAAKNGRLLS